MDTTATEPGSPTETGDEGFKKRTLAEHGGLAIRGFLMGSVDVVPGVSGGTMALLLGIYEELIQSIRVGGQRNFWHALLRLRIGVALRLANWTFLLAVFLGIGLAIITLAPGIEWMLDNQPELLWSFFFGLVSASVISVGRRIHNWNLRLWLALAAGAVIAFIVVGLVPLQTPDTWWFLILSGVLAASAMILPGISGSFILVLLGKYEFVVSAVNNRDIVSIALIGIGAVIGLITLTQILGWLFKRYHDPTLAVLTGLMVGSLRKLWPWKETLESMIDRHGATVPIVQINVLPPLSIDGAFNMQIVYALLLAALGFTAVLVMDYWASRHQT